MMRAQTNSLSMLLNLLITQTNLYRKQFYKITYFYRIPLYKYVFDKFNNGERLK